MIRALLVGVLLASLALNGYLAFLRDAPERPATVVVPPPTHTSSPKSPKVAVGAAKLADVREYATLDEATLEQRLAVAVEHIARLQPLEKRYAVAARSVESEEAIKPFLAQVFGDHPYEVECHALVCHLKARMADDNEWMGPLQSIQPGRALFGTMHFGVDGTYLDIVPLDERAAAIKQGVERTLFTSKEALACIESLPQTGHVDIRVDFVAASRRFHIVSNGALASHPQMACIVSALQKLLDAFTVPAGTPAIPTANIAFDLPLPKRP